MFIIGMAGTGKSKILRSLNKTYQNLKRKPVWQDLNPKAVTNDELFGYINPMTREWKDGECQFGGHHCSRDFESPRLSHVSGLFSSIMRDMANMANDSPKWIVLDGDIDPMWIESLNTVMDDNKVRLLVDPHKT